MQHLATAMPEKLWGRGSFSCRNPVCRDCALPDAATIFVVSARPQGLGRYSKEFRKFGVDVCANRPSYCLAYQRRFAAEFVGKVVKGVTPLSDLRLDVFGMHRICST
jgi:hypothetical protein